MEIISVASVPSISTASVPSIPFPIYQYHLHCTLSHNLKGKNLHNILRINLETKEGGMREGIFQKVILNVGTCFSRAHLCNRALYQQEGEAVTMFDNIDVPAGCSIPLPQQRRMGTRSPAGWEAWEPPWEIECRSVSPYSCSSTEHQI